MPVPSWESMRAPMRAGQRMGSNDAMSTMVVWICSMIMLTPRRAHVVYHYETPFNCR